MMAFHIDWAAFRSTNSRRMWPVITDCEATMAANSLAISSRFSFLA